MGSGRLSPTRRAASATCCAVVLAACHGSPPATGTSGASPAPRIVGVTWYPVAKRQPVPALVGTGLDGRPVSLADLTPGSVVVLNVWASWCAPCREEAPVLAKLSSENAARDVRFLGLDELDVPASARAFVTRTGSSYPQLMDEDGSLLHRLSLLPQDGIPSTVVTDRKARVAARVIGPVTAAQLGRILTDVVAEQ